MKKGYSKVTITEQELRDKYVNKNQSGITIARELGVSEWWVLQRLRQYNIHIKRGGSKFLIDIAGKPFGHYTVIKKVKSKGKQTYWLCRCDCGRYREVSSNELRSNEAESCGKCENSIHWKGVGEISGQYFCAIKSGAKRRKISFNLTKEYLWILFNLQQKKCAITGLPLVFVHSYGSDSSKQTASLDRIDSSKGYEEGNVRWVHKAVNIMRWHMTDEQLFYWAKKIVDGPIYKLRM